MFLITVDDITEEEEEWLLQYLAGAIPFLYDEELQEIAA